MLHDTMVLSVNKSKIEGIKEYYKKMFQKEKTSAGDAEVFCDTTLTTTN